jgi:hypothetical protein
VSAIFNGSTSALTAALSVLGSTPTYPVLLGGFVKLSAVTAAQAAVIVSDDQSSNFDFLELSVRGDQPNDPVQAAACAAGVSSSSAPTIDGATAGNWIWIGAYYLSALSRHAVLGSTLSTISSLTRNVNGLATTAIGKRRLGADSLWFGGRMAEIVVAQNFNNGDISTILTQLSGGTRPVNVSQLSGKLVLYQPLLAGIDEAGFVQSVTNNNVTFDAADHPVSYGVKRPLKIKTRAAFRAATRSQGV